MANNRISPALLGAPIVDGQGRPTTMFFQVWQAMVTGARPETWTPAIAGSGVAGTASYASRWGVSAPIGQFTLCLFAVTLSGVGGGISGNAEIVTLPAASSAAGGVAAGWISEWGGITLSGGYTMLGLSVPAGATAAALMQSGSGLASIPLPVSALSGASHVAGALFYPT